MVDERRDATVVPPFSRARASTSATGARTLHWLDWPAAGREVEVPLAPIAATALAGRGQVGNTTLDVRVEPAGEGWAIVMQLGGDVAPQRLSGTLRREAAGSCGDR